ncbi:ATP-dependent DNA helicase sgs1 [Puccinia graminis f. sp. tritici]|uniref:DNA 3'-5' helicase n=1 Tax=Puccinia graminis f. sp. tritici TaxID=56615 RepID=A0A5B0SGZ4_PUCGR|nr:ATP-dependent DNA helicase sgs1 [Puccinia graminis f. sp. tritici]
MAKRVRTPTGVNLYKKIDEKTDDKLKEFIKQSSMDTYQQEPKPLQVDTVFNLARGCNSFLLAGTGFGKSRISEMYFKMIPKSKRAVVLVLNPLDSLGDNQVLEKEKAGFTAINLTKMNFNRKTADSIKNGDYNFIYLSPEIFLNSKSFDEVYFSSAFQNRLALIVIDEAHMVYIWGLVESSTLKTINSVHLRIEDYALFRPCYGKLGPHLLFRNNKPILLLSATCRPVAVEGIMKSLKLNQDNLEILRGELTRPEIRIIRVTMDHSLASTLDLVKLFPSVNDVSNDDLVPTLIYSSSRNRTLTAMDVIDLARETPGAAFDPPSSCIRRFHSCTGEQDKADCIEDFAAGKFPMISCTMALGLGQNWKRVRMVVHMGRGDPASICQMIGRCGRDGRPGLAVLFVEKNRRNGKNSVNQFAPAAYQSDPDRMDALAITPVCLRIAFSMDNLLGYIPVSVDDPAYVRERSREIEAGMSPCKCSNCASSEAATLLDNLVLANKSNFDSIITDQFVTTEARNLSGKYLTKQAQLRKRKIPEADRPVFDAFKARLITDLHNYYSAQVGSSVLPAGNIFGDDEAEGIVSYMHHINQPNDIRGLIGGECFNGQLEWLFDRVCTFRSDVIDQLESGRPKRPRASVGVDNAPSGSILTPSSSTPRQISHPVVNRPPTKKALAAEASRRRSLERKAQNELWLISEQKRKEQVARILREGLQEANDRREMQEEQSARNDMGSEAL